ncbi:MAG: transposase [Maribacter sp.]|jgi:transposase
MDIKKEYIQDSGWKQFNLYFQDESRFGLMTHTGSCITACGVQPVSDFQHKFDNTYLWGSYSPIDGDSFVWEINGVSCIIFEQYLRNFSAYKPDEFKILVIDNAGFHSVKNITIPSNIYLLNIPAYCLELNPCEQIWRHIKQQFKNQVFENIGKIKEWLHKKGTGNV